ncbi:Alpha-1,3-mannosyl-glycoprotein 2-beta-N-acetylglucosaminyltransferase [Lamellibrachia satsuma]|nr:Alpha-1,3-mannosyl-glycoprotein 2-beta-N-acetylglucosaminyltransferase [Lamellibrachia satsuma]
MTVVCKVSGHLLNLPSTGDLLVSLGTEKHLLMIHWQEKYTHSQSDNAWRYSQGLSVGSVVLPSGGHEETFSDILSIGHLSDMECNDIYISVYKASKQKKVASHLAELDGMLDEQSAVQKSLLGQLNYLRQQKLAHEQNIKQTETARLLREGFDSQHNLSQHVLPVLVIACNRPAIKRCLDQLLLHRPSETQFPIIVSQDCGHMPTADVIRSYGTKVKHIAQPDLSAIDVPAKLRKFRGYFNIARHYKWALEQVFMVEKHKAVIIVEDDLDISPDFFEYFSATFPILESDPSLWCVSAWNDNGKTSMVADKSELLYRTDFFPGLGWMFTRSTFLELQPKWPKTFWDDWMRHPDQRRDRTCIRPEIPRTSTFGRIGISKGQFFDKHLKFIKKNEKFVPFTKMDLSYLKKENYDESFVQRVYSSPMLSISEVMSGAKPEAQAVRIQYENKISYKVLAKKLGIMDDLKSGVGRAGYRGVITFMFNGRRVYLAPPSTWSGYDTSWN